MKALVALAIPIIAAGVTFAGVDCFKGDDTVEAGSNPHCHMLGKQITKSFELTDDGAVVTLTGKTEKAVGHIQDHLKSHNEGEECPGCPLSSDDVETSFKMTDKGGVITATGSSPDAVKAVQKWAKAKVGQCCNQEKGAKV
jgi:hypothetical protein